MRGENSQSACKDPKRETFKTKHGIFQVSFPLFQIGANLLFSFSRLFFFHTSEFILNDHFF